MWDRVIKTIIILFMFMQVAMFKFFNMKGLQKFITMILSSYKFIRIRNVWLEQWHLQGMNSIVCSGVRILNLKIITPPTILDVTVRLFKW